MRFSETHDQSTSVRATTKKVGLRIAALTGVVLTASAIASAPAVGTAADANVVLDSVVATEPWPWPGSTCCGHEDPEMPII